MFVFTGRDFNYFILIQFDLFLCLDTVESLGSGPSYLFHKFFFVIWNFSELLNSNMLKYNGLTIIFLLHV